jgi:hypothetical protein
MAKVPDHTMPVLNCTVMVGSVGRKVVIAGSQSSHGRAAGASSQEDQKEMLTNPSWICQHNAKPKLDFAFLSKLSPYLN